MQYPSSQIWLVGHSLGGSIASLLGNTFGVPTVTFQAIPELLPSKRLHLPVPPISEDDDGGWRWDDPLGMGNFAYAPVSEVKMRSGTVNLIVLIKITHIFHTSDPIPLGVCNGFLSLCGTGGYALESRCHSGKTMMLDAVGRGYGVDLKHHSIKWVLDNALKEGEEWGEKRHNETDLIVEANVRWPWSKKTSSLGNTLTTATTATTTTTTTFASSEPTPSVLPPIPRPEDDCYDCFKWTFVETELIGGSLVSDHVLQEVRKRLKAIKIAERKKMNTLNENL
jgi:lipase ATG15